MPFGQIETPARPDKVGDDARPFDDIGKPDQGAPGDKHQIETIRDQGWRVIEIALDKSRVEPQFTGQRARRGDGPRREIQRGYPRAMLSQD